MKALANKLYSSIVSAGGFEGPVDACLLGCNLAFMTSPTVKVGYICRISAAEFCAGELMVNYRHGLFRGWLLYNEQKRSSIIRLSEKDQEFVGIGKGDVSPPRAGPINTTDTFP